ncbi:MAG: MFS transporter [Actinobacteria bacterium]|nr:MAG: MFS transporter [Actinomycetota bacterium]
MTETQPPSSTSAELQLYERPEIFERRWFLLGIMCLSLAMVVMSVSGLNVALPSIQESLQATGTDLQWIVDSYAIVFAGLLLTAGAIGDRFGRKWALQGGLVVFTLGSVIGAVADDVTQIIISRSIMGVGAAFIMPATLSIITAVFAPQERTKAIAIWAGFAGAGGALGPLVVGFLITDWWIFPARWWGSAFVVNIVAAVLVLIAVSVYSPRSRDSESTPLDPVGAVLSIVGLAALLYGIIEGPVKGWSSTEVVIAFVVAALGLVGFVFWELRQEYPMLPMKYFRNHGYSIGVGVITFGFLVMFGFFFLMTQFLQFVRGYSPLDAGVATLPLAFMLVLVSPRSAALGEKYGITKIISAGFVFLVAGLVLMSTVDTGTPYLVIAAALLLLGAGMGITIAPATGSIMDAVPLNKAGVGSAANDTSRELGGALGIAVLGSIANSVYQSEIDQGVLDALPPEAAEIAGESIGAAIAVSEKLPGKAGELLSSEAGDAFTSAFGTSLTAAAVVAAVSGIVVFIVGRRGEAIASPAPDAARPPADRAK